MGAKGHPMMRLARTFNGITIAYVMGLVNALLALLLAFGLTITPAEQGSIVAFVNAALVLVTHAGHRVGEVTRDTLYQPPVPPADPPQQPPTVEA